MTAAGTEVTLRHRERIPNTGATLVVSNHRSALDAPLLMAAIARPVRFACHHYMSQVPLLKEMIAALGCLPLDEPGQQRQQGFFSQASAALQAQQAVGIFPEGAIPMTQKTTPENLSPFQRGFAHLALRAPVERLAIVPIAIAALEETVTPLAPLKLFSFFDPSEPRFQQSGWHYNIHYHRVTLTVGHPIWITAAEREQYHGRQAVRLAKTLTQACHEEIARLLAAGLT
jgi:1-acyl-sn-glycerol-3-phosphate acyltransferase